MNAEWRTEYVGCNLCGSLETKRLYKKKGTKTGLIYNIVKCKNCGLIYINPRLTRESLTRLYNEDYYQEKGFIEKETYQDRESGIEKGGISLIESIKCRKPFRPGQALLDVGCGMGGLLYDAVKSGYSTKGVESSEYACNYLRQKGLDVYLGEFEDIDLGNEKFDIITAISVVEHLRSPLGFFKKVSAHLKKEGIFFYVTANLDSLISRISGARWDFIEPDRHLYYFTPSTITAYFERVGLVPRYLDNSFDAGRKMTRYLMKTGLLKKGNKTPQRRVEKIAFRFLRLLDGIRNINMPYAVKN